MVNVKSHTRKTKKGRTRVKAHIRARKPKVEWVSERGDELGLVVRYKNKMYDGYLTKFKKGE